MAHEVTLGGERLGAGKRQKIELHNYERSTHDIGYVWRSTMAAGTLVPFMVQVALPGDTFDIDLEVDVLTHPTIGPLFGSYKVQLDVFQVPVRLYQAKLHMNMLGIGLDMSKVGLPLIELQAPPVNPSKPIDNQQINPSSLFSYLGIRGLGNGDAEATGFVRRTFNAIPYLAYWDIYKNYYANKQEEIGAYIVKDLTPSNVVISAANLYLPGSAPVAIPITGTTYTTYYFTKDSYLTIAGTGLTQNFDPEMILLDTTNLVTGEKELIRATTIYSDWVFQNGLIIGSKTVNEYGTVKNVALITYNNSMAGANYQTAPEIANFPLKNIDDIRLDIMTYRGDANYTLRGTDVAPYGPPMASNQATLQTAPLFNQTGLALKTYQSDLFNNWVSTEWIDGPDGISEITAIDTSGGSFTIDELNLSKKVYDMLNRIAVSGGTYDDWLDAVYTHQRQRSAENPMYIGGLQSRLIFQEVVSNARFEDASTGTKQPLGTLAGRGRTAGKKGGHVVAKVDEPSYIIGIVSLTPYVDYSQGNSWDMNLKTMNDFHKPALDQIGFQDLITDQMAWWDTALDSTIPSTTFKSAGKQPAWVNYMTNVNKIYGNFADQTQQMYMVLARRYDLKMNGSLPEIADLTTYIDPSKFNHIFADTSLDAQNFWVQISNNITARRKMSAKVMPNL